jgi:hypothetical protein
LYLPPCGRASVGIRRPNATRPTVFRAWPTGASLTVDLATIIAPYVIEKAGSKLAGPLIGNCAAFLAEGVPPESLKSPSAMHELLSSHAVDCLKAAVLQLVRTGALDKVRVASMASTLDAIKRASVVGPWLEIYGYEWRLLDLFVDSKLVGGAGTLGNGFSVRAKNGRSPNPPSPPPPPPSPLPPSPPPAPPPVPPPAQPPPPPPPRGRITLTRGASAPAGYWYDVTLSGFAPGSRVTVTCRDSADPGGFWIQAFTINGAGRASDSTLCYSGDHPDHWVTGGGVESNRVRW